MLPALTLVLTITTARGQVIYDFSAQAGASRFGFKQSVESSFTLNANDVPTDGFDSPDYLAVGSSDTSRQTSDSTGGNKAATRFVFTLNEPTPPKRMEVLWQGSTQSGGSASFYLWDVTTSAYHNPPIGSTSNTSDFILRATTMTPARYIDVDQHVTLLILNTVAGKSVTTNYVRIAVFECDDSTECDDGNICTDDVCALNVCTHPANNNPCDDGDTCTVGDACADGACRSGLTAYCWDMGNQCNSASCDRDGAEGNCDIQTPFDDGIQCDDGDACTLNDVCRTGECSGGPAVDCSAFNDACHFASCDPAGISGNCDLRSTADDGTPCNDGIFCTAQDVCTGAVCTGSGNPCAKNEFCNEITSKCDRCRDDADCDDHNPCTRGEACVSGQCTEGNEFDCSAFDEPCRAAACDLFGALGNCDARVQIVNGAPCDDGIFCTMDDACKDGACVGERFDCSPLNGQCNVGFCDEESHACVAQPLTDGTSCDDGNPCTSGDRCLSGKCAGEVHYGLTEWATLAGCIAGPDGIAGGDCLCADVNADDRADLRDVAEFTRLFE